jgi:tight adherence protein C
LSIDQATIRVADELQISEPVISDELGLVNLEQRAGRPRADAWRNMAERTDVDSVRAMVSVLIQADQFGTSVAKTLRVYSDTLRTQRRQQAEEQAAKTTVKLVFPLVLFIFPSLFVVALGPSAIVMADAFAKYL